MKEQGVSIKKIDLGLIGTTQGPSPKYYCPYLAAAFVPYNFYLKHFSIKSVFTS